MAAAPTKKPVMEPATKPLRDLLHNPPIAPPLPTKNIKHPIP